MLDVGGRDAGWWQGGHADGGAGVDDLAATDVELDVAIVVAEDAPRSSRS